MTTEFIPVDEKKFDKKLRAMEKQRSQNRKQLDKMAERHYYKTELDHLEQIMRSCSASEESTQIALRGRYEYLKITYQTAVRVAQRKAAQILADPFRPELPSVTLNPTTPIQAIPFSEVEQQQIQWLWENRIPLGKITILEGDPGMGKSLL